MILGFISLLLTTILENDALLGLCVTQSAAGQPCDGGLLELVERVGRLVRIDSSLGNAPGVGDSDGSASASRRALSSSDDGVKAGCAAGQEPFVMRSMMTNTELWFTCI